MSQEPTQTAVDGLGPRSGRYFAAINFIKLPFETRLWARPSRDLEL